MHAHQRTSSTGLPTAWFVGLLLLAALVLAGCGSDGSGDDVAEIGEDPDLTPASAESATPVDGAASESAPQPSNGNPLATAAPYAVGTTIDADGEWFVTHLGLAEIPLGKDSIWTDGSCFVLLADIEHHTDFVDPDGPPTTFTPSVSGVFADGREANKDETGVDCDPGGLDDLGFVRNFDAELAVGESARVWMGSFHVPEADRELLEGVSLYGGDDLFEPEITESLLS